jgi:hypothetical protein
MLHLHGGQYRLVRRSAPAPDGDFPTVQGPALPPCHRVTRVFRAVPDGFAAGSLPPATSRAARAARSSRGWTAPRPGSATGRCPQPTSRQSRKDQRFILAQISPPEAPTFSSRSTVDARTQPQPNASPPPPGERVRVRGTPAPGSSTGGRPRNRGPTLLPLTAHLRPYRQPPHPRDAAGSAADRGDQPPAPQALEVG